MNLRKAYISPSIEEVNLDVSISVLMLSEDVLPDGTGGEDIWESTGSPSTTSTLEEDDSGIKENPFR